MKITDFAKEVCLIAGKNSKIDQVNIAQMLEIMAIFNKHLFGIPYIIIRNIL